MPRSSRVAARARGGRARGGAAAIGLGVRGGSVDHHRSSPSRSGPSRSSPRRSGPSRSSPRRSGSGRSSPRRRSPSRSGPSRSRRSASRESSPSTREIHVVSEPEEERSVTPSEHSYEEYSPRTPTQEEYQEEALRLHGEIAMLRDDLSRSQEETAGVREVMHRLQRMHAERQARVDELDAENDAIREVNGTLNWQCVELEWELRMASRSWMTRLGDRTRYYRAATSGYFGMIQRYCYRWWRLFLRGPSLSFLWRYRPERSYEEEVRLTYYPYDLH